MPPGTIGYPTSGEYGHTNIGAYNEYRPLDEFQYSSAHNRKANDDSVLLGDLEQLGDAL
jgi:hypothetical protein